MTARSEERSHSAAQTRKKHPVILLLLSGFLVFAAFIVRDELREDVRELANSISSAQTVFTSRQDISVLAEQIRASQELANEILFAVFASADNPKAPAFAESRWEHYEVDSIRTYVSSFNVSPRQHPSTPRARP